MTYKIIDKSFNDCVVFFQTQNNIISGLNSNNKQFSINCNIIRNASTNENDFLSLKEFYNEY